MDKLMNTEIVPFRINIPQQELDLLRDKLERSRLPDELPNTEENYGVKLDYVKDLADYWQNEYDWRKQEAFLNKFPQYTTNIDGATIHFLHIRSPEENALPLIMTHGWPGSIVEFVDVIEPLTNPRAYGGNPDDAFHLVIPSIPGYGFSSPLPDESWDLRRIAHAWAELMKRLGYERYGAQGGDWGSAISRELGVVAPNNVVGVHLNYIETLEPSDSSNLSTEDKERFAQKKERQANFFGYLQIQASRPQTISYALADSPIGQLAWIAEKFVDWTDPSSSIAKDHLLTNVMFYWLTNTSGSAAKLYAESAKYWVTNKEYRLKVPIGVAVFPYDISLPVYKVAEQHYSIIQWSEFDRGGHFAALEVPGLLIDDIRSLFRKLL